MGRNFLLERVKWSNAETFTTDLGIKIRRKIYKPLQVPLRLATDGKIILESIKMVDGRSIINVEKDLSYLNLEQGVPYIFASTHSFNEDINAALAILDRNAYLLLGSTDQIEHNIEAHAVWTQGMVYVNRLDKESRHEAIKKMVRLLEAGTSVLLFPEGGYNNTENLIVGNLFNGPYTLAQLTKCKVIPIASFREAGANNIYITVGQPLDFTNISKEEYQIILRDTLATMMFELWYHHAGSIKRKSLNEDCRQTFMEERKKEYLKNPWTHDVWDEEIVEYYNPYCLTPEQVRESLDRVKVTKDNAKIMGPILVKRQEDKKYNFKQYMKNTWDK